MSSVTSQVVSGLDIKICYQSCPSWMRADRELIALRSIGI